jgi:hypothetical protein
MVFGRTPADAPLGLPLSARPLTNHALYAQNRFVGRVPWQCRREIGSPVLRATMPDSAWLAAPNLDGHEH